METPFGYLKYCPNCHCLDVRVAPPQHWRGYVVRCVGCGKYAEAESGEAAVKKWNEYPDMAPLEVVSGR